MFTVEENKLEVKENVEEVVKQDENNKPFTISEHI